MILRTFFLMLSAAVLSACGGADSSESAAAGPASIDATMAGAASVSRSQIEAVGAKAAAAVSVAARRYTVVNVGSGKCLDVAGASTTDGGNLQQWACNTGAQQSFDVVETASGIVKLINANSGKAIDITAASPADGANAQQWTDNGTSAQRFELQALPGGSYSFVNIGSGKCLDIASGGLGNGANLQQWACKNVPGQQFFLKPASDVVAVVAPGRYTLTAAHSGKCLDVASSAINDGANVQQWACNGTGAQAFDISRDASGDYRIVNAHSGKLVEVRASDTADGANVQQWAEVNGTNQRFTLQPDTAGHFTLVAEHSGKCVDVAALAIADGSNVQQWACNGKTNQLWTLTASTWTEGGGGDGGGGGGSAMAAKRQRVLDFVASLSGKKAMLGIENKNASTRPTADTDRITAITGRVSSFWGADFGFGSTDVNNRSTIVAEAKRQFAKGAMVSLMYHACVPTRDEYCSWEEIGGVRPAKLSVDQFKQLTTAGTALNARWLQRLDTLAGYFQDLKNAGVVVMFRPFHEVNQCAFWWACHPEATGSKKLYQLTHDYLTKTKGLDNIIWVWNIQDFVTLGSDVDTYSPGSAYFDIASLDIYNTGWTQQNYNAMLRIAGGKPIAVAECQFLPTSAQLAAQNRWTFVMLWPDFIDINKAALPALYRADNVLTLDEMPGWQ